jgi:hypothetical protein
MLVLYITDKGHILEKKGPKVRDTINISNFNP